MSVTVTATGTHPGAAPTLHISGGAGNSDFPHGQVHVAFRDDDSESSRLLQAWFPAEAILQAVAELSPEPSAQTGQDAE